MQTHKETCMIVRGRLEALLDVFAARDGCNIHQATECLHDLDMEDDMQMNMDMNMNMQSGGPMNTYRNMNNNNKEDFPTLRNIFEYIFDGQDDLQRNDDCQTGQPDSFGMGGNPSMNGMGGKNALEPLLTILRQKAVGRPDILKMLKHLIPGQGDQQGPWAKPPDMTMCPNRKAKLQNGNQFNLNDVAKFWEFLSTFNLNFTNHENFTTSNWALANGTTFNYTTSFNVQQYERIRSKHMCRQVLVEHTFLKTFLNIKYMYLIAYTMYMIHEKMKQDNVPPPNNIKCLKLIHQGIAYIVIMLQLY